MLGIDQGPRGLLEGLTRGGLGGGEYTDAPGGSGNL